MSDEMHYEFILPDNRTVEFAQGLQLVPALTDSTVDGLIIEGLWGFNDLGGFGNIIGEHLGKTRKYLQNICVEIQEKEEICIMCILSANPKSRLRAVALTPIPPYGKYAIDYYYHVVFEAMSFLAGMKCVDIGIASITGSLELLDNINYHLCVAEATVHCVMQNPSVRRVCSVGDGPQLSYGINFFNEQPESIGCHREIRCNKREDNGVWLITLEMPHILV